MNAVGSTYRFSGFIPPMEKNHENSVEIMESVPHTRFVFRAHDANGYFENIWTLRTVDGGTEVTYHHKFPKMVGIGRVLLPLLLPLVGKKDEMKRLGILKAKVESAR